MTGEDRQTTVSESQKPARGAAARAAPIGRCLPTPTLARLSEARGPSETTLPQGQLHPAAGDLVHGGSRLPAAGRAKLLAGSKSSPSRGLLPQLWGEKRGVKGKALLGVPGSQVLEDLWERRFFWPLLTPTSVGSWARV